jgi:DNA-directed RNA polymerase specialized sigma24 family protein
MARIEYIKYRLNNWALWKVRESTGSLGYATCSVLLHEPVDGDRELRDTIEDTDAELTNAAVESLRVGRAHLHRVLYLIYIEGKGIKEAARVMLRAESTIKANLGDADHALQAWFNDRAEAKK